MASPSDEKLDRLLKEAYPALQVSPDFTLRLWRRLMKSPARPPWMLPVPVAGVAAVIGICAGLISWAQLFSTQAALASPVRFDLFGNAPFDSLAGSFLKLIG